MSPLRRRSARLASAATPNIKTSLKLPSLAERNEHDESQFEMTVQTPGAAAAASSSHPCTPAASSPIKPSLGEMHPSKVHPTMAPPSVALRLGFADISHSAKARTGDRVWAAAAVAAAQSTPTKAAGIPSSPFTFRQVRPEADQGLSSQAQRLMDELREEAAKIKADLTAQRERQEQADEQGEADSGMCGRKIAKPKGKSGRFSAAHMSQFKKMDSIENHASAFRAVPGRFTPVTTPGLKRSSSRANLDETEFKSSMKRSPTKSKLDDALVTKPSLKRSPSKANLDDSTSSKANTRKAAITASASKTGLTATADEPPSPVKRIRQRLEDDASSSRPTSREGSFLPRPKSSHGNSGSAQVPRSQTLALLTSPTKASMARSAAATTKLDVASTVKSPSKSVGLAGFARSVTTNNLVADEKSVESRPRIISPGRFERVKSILRGNKGAEKAKSAIPLAFTGSQTPAPQRVVKSLRRAPVTSPRRNKLVKRPTLEFTPQTRHSVFTEATASPSPIRSGIPKSKTMRNLQEIQYPTLDRIIMEEKLDDVAYPDLSKHQAISNASTEDTAAARAPPSIPGTFTFRSDHTISFGPTSPTGFGGSPGQSSVRHVRSSIMPTANMPGSFPVSMASSSSHALAIASSGNKENRDPVLKVGRDGGKPIFSPLAFSHGIGNKKRHRPSWDEDEAEAEAENRAAKKRKQEAVPEGDALLAPRLIGMTPSRMTPSAAAAAVPALASSKKKPTIRHVNATPTPAKKRAMLSLSRLNLLAKPKNRA